MSKNKSNNSQAYIYESFVIIEEDKERAVRFDRLLNDLKDLAGKVLTVIDASISDEKQNKAIKDLIKSNFAKTIGRYENICFYGKQDSEGLIHDLI